MAKKQKDEPAMAKVRELLKESGLSLVELGRRMGYSEEIARQSAWQFMQAHDPRMSMLRKFAEAIGVPLDHLTPRGKRMSRKLEIELEECHCDLSPDDFRDLIIERKHDTSPAWTIDELVCHPDEAKEYCNVIRTATGCPTMPDDLILRTLMNVRRSN
jgi:transcriptional regulator with XRE-family HTH domain